MTYVPVVISFLHFKSPGHLFCITLDLLKDEHFHSLSPVIPTQHVATKNLKGVG